MASTENFELRNIEIDIFENADGDLLVDRVKFLTPDAEEGQVTFKPRTTSTDTVDIDGMEMTDTKTVRYTAAQFRAAYDALADAQQRLRDGEVLTLRAEVSTFDQSKADDVEGDKVYRYIDRSAEDSIKILEDAETPETPETEA